ncbi:hypothetical protein [Leptospira noguchii]|uniref:hypothetical protein n=1 Tax=Leptospira noguchii TaxID=28182 RepID=UPI001C679AC1|nr:hypothetical protein [Leptospira noguchii]
MRSKCLWGPGRARETQISLPTGRARETQISAPYGSLGKLRSRSLRVARYV